MSVKPCPACEGSDTRYDYEYVYRDETLTSKDTLCRRVCRRGAAGPWIVAETMQEAEPPADAAWNAMPRRSDGPAWRSEPPNEPGWWLACRMVGGKPRQVELTKVEEVCVVTTNGLPLNDPKRLWWFGPLPDGAAAGDAEKEVTK